MALTEQQKLYNQALGLIGQYQIDTGTSTTAVNYEICERYYEDVRNQVLSSHLWNEAMERDIVLEDTTMPLFDYDYRYALPSDCLRVISIGTDTTDWVVEGSYVLSDYRQMPPEYNVGSEYAAGQYVSYQSVTYLVNTAFTASDWTTDLATYLTTQSGDYGYIKLLYVKELTDITSYSPRLKDAIAQALAIKIAVQITGDHKVKSNLINEFEQLTMPKARSVDAMQGRPRNMFNSKFIRSRY